MRLYQMEHLEVVVYAPIINGENSEFCYEYHKPTNTFWQHKGFRMERRRNNRRKYEVDNVMTLQHDYEGKTIEIGTGNKHADNPYTFKSVENFDLISTDNDKNQIQ